MTESTAEKSDNNNSHHQRHNNNNNNINGCNAYFSFNGEWIRLLAALGFWCPCLVANMIGGSIAAQRYDRTRPALPDVGYSLIPLVDWQEASDAYFILLAVCTGFRLILLSRDGMAHLRRFFLLHGACMAQRALSLNLTLLPDANPTCQRLHHIPRVTSYAPFSVSCGDMMFSGHVVAWTIFAWMWQCYATNRWEKVAAWLSLVGGCALMSALRQHYAIDIVAAVYVGTCTFLAYHAMYTIDELYHHRWNVVIRWMEKRPTTQSVEGKKKR